MNTGPGPVRILELEVCYSFGRQRDRKLKTVVHRNSLVMNSNKILSGQPNSLQMLGIVSVKVRTELPCI